MRRTLFALGISPVYQTFAKLLSVAFLAFILQRPPLSFGHFPRERGNPDSFAKGSCTGARDCSRPNIIASGERQADFMADI